jgi:hypothetical protein
MRFAGDDDDNNKKTKNATAESGTNFKMLVVDNDKKHFHSTTEKHIFPLISFMLCNP